MKIGLFTHAGADRPLLAVSLLLMATFTLACQDSLMKLVSTQTSIWQIQTLRSAGNVFFVILLAMSAGGLTLLVPRNTAGVVVRAFLLAICMFFFFSGAPHLSVAQMAAGLYTYPLFVSLLAGPVLGETIGVWRFSAVVVGAVGSALILSPWKDGFSTVQVLPLIAGFFYACNILCLRRWCREESTLALAFVAGFVFMGIGLVGITLLGVFDVPDAAVESMPFVAIGWPTLTLGLVGIAIGLSILNLCGNICLTRAYQTADASLLAPLDFTYLVFAACWGKLLFDRWPTALQLIGMLFIISAGVVTAWREQRIKD